MYIVQQGSCSIRHLVLNNTSRVPHNNQGIEKSLFLMLQYQDHMVNFCIHPDNKSYADIVSKCDFLMGMIQQSNSIRQNMALRAEKRVSELDLQLV